MSVFQDHEFSPPIGKMIEKSSYETQTTSMLSIISLVSGILGMTLVPVFGSLVAIATGHAALGQIRDSGGRVDGKELARVGLGLGYLQMVFALILLIILSFVVPFMVNAAVNSVPATTVSQVVEKTFHSRGVKMVNEMTREDFEYIDINKLEIKPDEILACYYSGFEALEPEFALMTKQKLIYLKEGRTVAFDLKDVSALKDDRAYELAYNTSMIGGALQTNADHDIYHVEVQSKNGPRMRIEITPPKDGPIFFDVLKSTVETSGGTAGSL